MAGLSWPNLFLIAGLTVNLLAMVEVMADAGEPAAANNVNPLPDDQVVATVNGESILAGDVLRSMRQQFAQYEARLKREYGSTLMPTMMNSFRHKVVKQALPRFVERKLLVQASKKHYPPKQLEEFQRRIDAEWESQIQEMIRQNKVQNLDELQKRLVANNYDLAVNRVEFNEQQWAAHFVAELAQSNGSPSDQELRTYYEAHRAEYTTLAKVRWQQLEVSSKAKSGTEGARKAIAQAAAELETGADFTAVVGKYGDDAKAKSGGIREWAEKGAFLNRDVEQALFTLPIKGQSDIIQTSTGFEIVRVLERSDESVTPFENVKEKIESHLKQEAYKARAKAAIKKVHDAAIIEISLNVKPTTQHFRSAVEFVR